MSRSIEEETVQWISELTDQQVRALSHQIGITGSVTYPIDKLRRFITERKRLVKAVGVYKEHYADKEA